MNDNDAPPYPRNQPRISDEVLAGIARDPTTIPNTPDALHAIADICAELLRYRRVGRADSRRSEQVKRLRWQVENMTTKAEELLERARELSGKTEGETLDRVIESEEAKPS